MNREQPSHQEKKYTNVDETLIHQAAIAAFFSQIKPDESGSLPYDHMSEFHVSGNNSRLIEALQGKVNPDSVEVFYENDQPTQVKLYYRLDEGGQGINIVLKGKALADYLSFKEKQEEASVEA